MFDGTVFRVIVLSDLGTWVPRWDDDDEDDHLCYFHLFAVLRLFFVLTDHLALYKSS